MEFPEKFNTTADIKIPEKLIDQVIGQEKAVEIAKLVAKHRRHLLLLGEPGTGKSMIARAIAELLEPKDLVDVLVYPNPKDENNPLIRVVPAGEGQKIIEIEQLKSIDLRKANTQMFVTALTVLFGVILFLLYLLRLISDLVFIFLAIVLLLGYIAYMIITSKIGFNKKMLPKLLIDRSDKKVPFVEITAPSGAYLFGNVRHDPFQSGGLETPPHLRVEPGAIHQAHKGVLYIDEIGTFPLELQQELLTAMQDKKYPIKGRDDRSAGAIVKTEPVPCDFILVAAGNYPDLQKLHPALRSRILGNGYEVVLESDMPDTDENRMKIAQFIAQEVKRDGKIPHFSYEAAVEILKEAKKLAGRKDRLTTRFRELGGLIRIAGDIAKSKGKNVVEVEDVLEAKKTWKPLEYQLVEHAIDKIRKYYEYSKSGERVGVANGMAVLLGEKGQGIVCPVEAQVVYSPGDAKIIAGTQLGDIAKTAINNVGAIIKKVCGKDLKNYDIYIQLIPNLGEKVEGDSASITIALAIFSAITGIPIRQDIAMTGSLSIKGEVLAVGGITQKVEGAIKEGFKNIIIPAVNKDDLVLDESLLKDVNIYYVRNFREVLDLCLVDCKEKKELLKKYDQVMKD